jgi:hypothetical protein
MIKLRHFGSGETCRIVGIARWYRPYAVTTSAPKILMGKDIR